jgi:hypothetical protein
MNVDNRTFWSFFKTSHVTVSVKRQPEEPCAVFHVKSLIDLGSGRQTAMLEGYIPDHGGRPSAKKTRLSMPSKIGNLDIVYTTKTITPVSRAYQVIGQILRSSCTDRIVPDVIAPGDLLVLTRKQRRSTEYSIEALRVMPQRKMRYAV